MKQLYLTAICGLLITSNILSAQTQIFINPGEVLHDIQDNPLGLNVNTWVDNDANRPAGARPLREALAETGTRYLRFPGGEKADGYIWAQPPYNDPSTATVLRRGPTEFPYSFAPLFDSLTNTWTNDNYHFDLFMADCQAIDCEPVIVVALDNIYRPAQPGGSTLTEAETQEMAVEWVRYANITKGYGIKYWLLGNETWNPGGYNGAVPPMEQYGTDAAEFARAMKAVDPTIMVGINGNSYTDFDLALRTAGDDVDFLDVHSYPALGFTDYTDYLNTPISVGGIINQVELALLYPSSGPRRDRMPITVSETSAFGFTNKNGGYSDWDTGNNLGQSLANFDLFAQLLGDDRVLFSQFWNTRWINDDAGISHGEDLLRADNELNASGQILSILKAEAKDYMVATTSTSTLRSFASLKKDGTGLTIFLINKDTNSVNTELDLGEYQANATATRSVFRGNDVQDTDPEYVTLPDLSITGGKPFLTLPPHSLTVLRVSGSMATCGTNIVRGGRFETEGLQPWQIQTSGSAYAYQDKNNNVNEGVGSGGIGGGPASLTQTLTGLQPNTDYILSAQVKYFRSGSNTSRITLGVRDFGGSAQEVKIFQGSNSAFQTYTVPFTTGPTASTATVYFQNTSTATIGWIDQVEVKCDAATFVLPAKITKFTGKVRGQDHVLDWTVADERDVDRYEVEYSADGRDWLNAGKVAAAPGDQAAMHYDFTHQGPGRELLYRLRTVDFDGSYAYSNIISVGTNLSTDSYNIYPNPTSGSINLPTEWVGSRYRITSALGQPLMEGYVQEGGRLQLHSLSPGLYTLTIDDRLTYRIVRQ